jgi:hypothetical protein
MQDESTIDGVDIEHDLFGIEPDPDDPAYNADPDDMDGAHDHPEGES